MSRKYRRYHGRSKRAAAKRVMKSSAHRKPALTADAPQIQLCLDASDTIEQLQQSLNSFAIEMGLLVACQLLEHEVAQRCGPRYARHPDREATRYGHQAGVVILGGQKLPISKPRMRHVDGRGEASLEMYAQLQNEQAMPEACLRRLVRGVSCRNYEEVVDMAVDGFGVKRSSVSRGFVRASAEQIKQLAQRRFDGVRFVAIFIDGVEYAEEIMLVAMGVTENGEKRILGLRQGGSENTQVVSSLLEELRERGLAVQEPTLFVLDGAKALHSGVKHVWGNKAVIQRCQVHKKRNVKSHLHARHHAALERQLNAAYHETDYEKALKGLQTTARWLDRISPDAAGSLREGMKETLTVVRLGIPPLLRKTLATTNPIESAFDTVRTVTGRVKRWRDGDMRKRWCVAGLLRAESRFHRVQGYRQIHVLVTALQSASQPTKIRTSRKPA